MTPDIKQSVEMIEEERAIRRLEALEIEEGFVPKREGLSEDAPGWLQFGGAFVLGVMLAILAAVFNFLFFVWLFHAEFL